MFKDNWVMKKHMTKVKKDTYTGERNKKGQPHGKGTMVYAYGNKYVGKWRDSKFHGQGTYTLKDGTVEKGVWEKGELVKPKK